MKNGRSSSMVHIFAERADSLPTQPIFLDGFILFEVEGKLLGNISLLGLIFRSQGIEGNGVDRDNLRSLAMELQFSGFALDALIQVSLLFGIRYPSTQKLWGSGSVDTIQNILQSYDTVSHQTSYQAKQQHQGTIIEYKYE